MIRKLIMYLRLFLSNQYTKYKIYSKYLDIKFGDGVRILHYPRWGSEPFLIEIGNNVTITRGVTFVNHDGGVALFREEYPGLNFYGKIKIGNNVFIGINSIILPGVTIGDNVVIGAGTIVNKDIQSNTVVAGVPVKKIKDLSEYKEAKLKNAIMLDQSNNRKQQILNFIDKTSNE